MQGFMFLEFKNYIQKKAGPAAWDAILKKSGIGAKMYISLLGYPDEEFNAITLTASEYLNIPVPTVIEELSFHLVPGFLRIASHKIDPKWDILDLTENIPIVFRHVLVSAFVGSMPPLMKFVRTKPDEVMIYYTSPRKLCIMGKSIVKGFAKHMNEEVRISELSCMLKGDPQCQILVKKLPKENVIKPENPFDQMRKMANDKSTIKT